jgi:hypothetical protein
MVDNKINKSLFSKLQEMRHIGSIAHITMSVWIIVDYKKTTKCMISTDAWYINMPLPISS